MYTELTNLRRHVARHLTTAQETASESQRVTASMHQQSRQLEPHEVCNASHTSVLHDEEVDSCSVCKYAQKDE